MRQHKGMPNADDGHYSGGVLMGEQCLLQVIQVRTTHRWNTQKKWLAFEKRIRWKTLLEYRNAKHNETFVVL